MRLITAVCAAALLSGCVTVPVSETTPSLARQAAAPLPALTPLPASVESELPRNARPYHYAISVTPDAQNLTFTGSVTIDLELFDPGRTITLNDSKLAISQASLQPVGGGTPVTLDVALDPEKEQATFIAPEPMPAGRYTLSIDYSGPIGLQASGIFAIDYPDKVTGKTVRGVFTQFETPDAREFAPMFDEPSYKATWDLTAIVPQGQMAVSNMPVASEEDLGNGTKRVRFETTPPMSSYLLFFGMGDLERLAKDAGDGIEVGIVSPRGSGETARYALDTAADLIPYYNDYFGVKYPLPKLDNIAAPGSSQQFGAMENWGAIFTFEKNLLLDPNSTSPSQLNYNYTAEAHEMAHQWFGDLVTMAWWDDLWLNEGFASWMETKATQHFHPDWYADIGKVNTRERAMGLDSLQSTHPIIIHAKTAAEADLNFDAIAYSKGESVISMLEDYVGPDVWRDGIRRYMKAHEYSNATTADLWEAVRQASGKDIAAIADGYTKQSGVPLVAVSASCADGKTILSLKQGQFSRDQHSEVAANPKHWLVPMTVFAADGSKHRELLDGSDTVTVPGCGPTIVNGGQLGYFRTQYDPAMLARFAKAMPQLDPKDQLGLYEDALALAGAGYQDYAPALSLLASVPVDANPVVARSVVSSWGSYYDTLDDTDQKVQRAELAAMMHRVWLPRLMRLGFDPKPDESLADQLLRSTLVATLGEMGDETVTVEASRRFKALESDNTALDGPMKTTWLGIVAKNANEQQWNFLRTLARQAKTSIEQSIYQRLLGDAKDKMLARKALDIALTDEVGAQNAASVIRDVSNNFSGMAYDFAMAHREQVLALVDNSSRPAFIPSLAGGSHDPAMLDKLEKLAAETPEAEKLPVTKAIASLKQRLATRPRTQAQVGAWIDANAGK